tara:strand:- start:430 stop:1020 length:591 start_codon:yes stop_codon:yes gene_type:complete
MAGTFPSTAGFQTLDFTSNTNTRTSVSVSGKTQRLQTGSQYWSFTLKSPKKDRADVMSDYAFLVTQNGQADTFTIVPPVITDARGTASGVITINATYAAGQSLVKGNGGSGTLKKGDIIKFSNHTKVYMITEDINMDSSSEDFFNIYPPLVTGITNSTTVTYDDVPFKVYLTGDNIQYKSSTDGKFQYQIKVNEEI